jgi:RNA polymerase sigma-70 factor (ECF subfamily)
MTARAAKHLPDEIDELTLRRAQGGEPSAFRELVVHYHRRVYDLVWRMVERDLGSGAADDVTQETFLRVHRALPRYSTHGTARLSTWILTIASRLALNELRNARRRPVATDAAAVELSATERTDASLVERQLAAMIAAALARLSPELRAVLVLREYHDLSYGELASCLDIELGTVKSRLARARAAMREELEEVRHG